jgi:hypothetical protein
MDAQSQTVKLIYPRKFGGIEVTELTLRRPTGRDYLQAQKKDTLYEENVQMVANLCSLSLDEVLGLDLQDIEALVKQYQRFLSKSPPAKSAE